MIFIFSDKRTYELRQENLIAIHLLIKLFYWERLYYRSQLEDFNMYIELICNNTRIEIGAATYSRTLRIYLYRDMYQLFL